mmetsp:Transcript_68292/g.187179  ORF Transcript_68292/g.187179 Transcript_68292/m.187179 type:complete len:396 (+) Transcript_68292:44-1231(+)
MRVPARTRSRSLDLHLHGRICVPRVPPAAPPAPPNPARGFHYVTRLRRRTRCPDARRTASSRHTMRRCCTPQPATGATCRTAMWPRAAARPRYAPAHFLLNQLFLRATPGFSVGTAGVSSIGGSVGRSSSSLKCLLGAPPISASRSDERSDQAEMLEVGLSLIASSTSPVLTAFANGDLGSTRTATSARDRSTVAWAALGGPGAPCFRTVPSPKTSTRGRVSSRARARPRAGEVRSTSTSMLFQCETCSLERAGIVSMVPPLGSSAFGIDADGLTIGLAALPAMPTASRTEMHASLSWSAASTSSSCVLSAASSRRPYDAISSRWSVSVSSALRATATRTAFCCLCFVKSASSCRRRERSSAPSGPGARSMRSASSTVPRSTWSVSRSSTSTICS